MKCPNRILVGVFLFIGAAGLTVLLAGRAPNPVPPTPVPTPTLPFGVYRFDADLDGQRYRCLLYSGHSVDCDWNHPLTTPSALAAATPTPAPSRTHR